MGQWRLVAREPRWLGRVPSINHFSAYGELPPPYDLDSHQEEVEAS